MGKTIKRVIALAAVALALMPCTVAAEPAIPDTFQIGTGTLRPMVFRSLWEADDWLLIFPYVIEQYPQETTPASQLFTFRLYDATSGTPIASASVYDYNNWGFGMGMGAIYLSSQDVPDPLHELQIIMGGSPVYWFTDPPLDIYPLTSANYNTQSDQYDALASYIVGAGQNSLAYALEIDWGVQMQTIGPNGARLLTYIAQTYFTQTIPGLGMILPEIMTSISIIPPWTATAPGTSAAEGWGSQWEGTAFKAELEEWGETWGVAWNAITGVILFAFMLMCAGISQLKFGNGDPGFITGNVIFIIGTFAGLIYWPIVFVEMIILGYWIGHNMFWRNG